MKNKKILALIFAAFAAAIGTFLNTTSTSALSVEEKSVYEGLVTCYGASGFNSPVRLDEYQYSSSDYYKNLSIISDAGNGQTLPLINGYYSKSNTNCTGIIIGNTRGTLESGNLFGGLQSIGGLHPADPDNYSGDQTAFNEAVTSFMDVMGYNAGTSEQEINTTKKCFALPYSDTVVTDYSVIDMGAKFTNYGCLVFDKDNKLKSIATEPYAQADKTFDMAWFEAVDGPSEWGDIGLKLTAKYCVLGGGLCSKNSHTYWYNIGSTYNMEDIRNEWYQKISEGGLNAAYSYMSIYYPGKPQDIPDVVDYKDVASIYSLRSGLPEYGDKVMQKVENYGALAFSEQEKIGLYQYYIKDYYKATIKGCYTDSNSISYYKNQEGYKNSYNITDATGTTFTCLVSDPTEHKNDKVNGLNGEMHFKDKQFSFTELISELDGSTTTETLTEGAAPSSEHNPSGGSDVNCYTSTSLGWILCPVLDLVNGAVDGLYGMVEKQLVTETTLVGSSNAGGSGTYQGWRVFQNFANILVIILLLFVIFSQITGVGIDNYGIKKTLPKLIIAAVLVNISFIVCQFCADLSNIFGVNLKEMFESFAGSVTSESSIGVLTGFISTALTGGAIAGVGALAYFTWEFWIIPVLIALVGMLISILFFFILLSVRKAFIIVFIVIAPLALACYMLPNTKKWFDKWVKAFGAMLLVYPICGLAMGAGDWVSALLMKVGSESSDGADFLFYLVAALMSVVPFFFIPTLLKNGMAAIGSIGGKIAGMGDKLSGSVKRGLSNADATKDAQRRLGMRHNLKTVNRLQSKLDKNGKLSGYQKRRMNNARLAYNKAAKEDLDAEAGGVLLTPGSTGYDAYLKAQESAQSKQNLDNEVARMGDETNNYDTDTMNDKLKAIMNRQQQGKLSPEEELRMRALMYKMATGSGYSKKALAKTVASGSNAEARSAAAKFMSKNGDVASAINSKDLGAGQYLREVNNGHASTDFATWQGTMRDDGMTNAQFVLNKVITDNGDFMGQSASVVAAELGLEEHFDAATNTLSFTPIADIDSNRNIVSKERLQDMVNSEHILETADADVRRAVLAAAQARGVTIPSKWIQNGTAPAPAPDPQPHDSGPMQSGDSGGMDIDH